MNQEEKTDCIKALKEYFKCIKPDSNETKNKIEEEEKQPRFSNLIKQFSGKNKAPDYDRGNELDDYLLKSEYSDRNIKILDFWRVGQRTYPILSKIAKDVLSAQSSSAESERLFSAASNFMSSRRNKLKLKIFSKSLCLESWIKFE